MKKKSIIFIKNLFLIIVGTLILALGTAIFIIPFDLVIGGISSIAIIISNLFNFKAISTDMLITIITWVLFFTGWIFLGKTFALKTLISAIVYPVGISFFSRMLDPQFFGGIFNLSQSQYSSIAILLAAIFGGVLVGAGCALTFLGGGSTGGVDIFAFIICKVFKRLKSSVVIFVIDALTIIVGMFVIKDLVISLLGITSAFLSAIVIDKLFLGDSKAFIAQIVSQEYQSINKYITENLERTTSIIDIEGGYTGEKRKMLMVTFSMNQYNELINIINKTDPKAFIMIHRGHEIYGLDWTR